MQENNDKNQGKNGLSFESLDILIAKWKDGTFSEIIDDWKWIFGYSVRYKWAIVFYTILGIFSTSMGLVSSVAGKYLIDIITGYKTNKLMILIIVMVGSSLFSLLFSSIISRISTKLSIYINNDIQADIFDKIVDADWLEINKYSNGDVLNRFNGDIGTVSSNAISWLPTIVIAIYNFIATFLVILHYNAVMAILALASAPFMLLMSRFMIKKQREYSQKTREMSSKLMTFEVGRLRTMEEWTKTAEDMMRAGTLFVLLTGGEPLLYPHFRELYQKLRELGMIITINTNGTLIDEAWADFFAENKPRRINITLYGASNETYERLCHYPGGFDKAVNGIRLLRERNIDVKVNGSLAKANVDDRMKIIELGESLDAPVRIDTYMYPSVRERNHAYNNQARLDPEMAAKARVEVLQREMGEEVFAQYRKIQLDEAENTPEGEAVPGQMACRAGKSSFVVNWQGEMRSCVVLDKPSIPLRNVEFEEAWKFTKKETESLRISARCSSCKLRKVCNTCVAAAIAETGKADGVPEYLCRYTEATVRYLKETSKK